MNPEQILPRVLRENKESPLLEVDDFSCIEYFQYKEQRQVRALVTTSLFVVILSGRKVIYTGDGELHLEAGSCFFARKGSYMYSEILSSQDAYRNLIFFIDDRFLARFLKEHPPAASSPRPAEAKSIFLISMTPLLKSGIESFLPYFTHECAQRRALLGLKLKELLLLICEADSDGNFLAFCRRLFPSANRI